MTDAPETTPVPACRRCGHPTRQSDGLCFASDRCADRLHAQLTDERERLAATDRVLDSVKGQLLSTQERLAAWKAAGRSLHFKFPEGHPAIARLVALGEIEEKA